MPKKKTALTIEERLQQALVPAEEQPYEVPENWVWVRLGSLADVKGGKRLPKGNTFSEKITKHPYIRVTDFDDSGVSLDALKYIDEEVFEKISRYTISSEDIYVSIAGSIGKVGIIPSCIDGANLTENAAKLTNIKGINQKALCLFLKSEFAQFQMQSATISTTQSKLALFRIESLFFPLPPLSEQQRIVERIEELFAKLDEAKERLQEVADSFAVRKAAILHKAFTGELTKQWRRENGVSDESWEEKKLGDICKIGSGGTPSRKHEEYYNGNIPWIKTGELAWNVITESEEYITEEAVANSSAKMHFAGSVLVAMYGQGLTRGKAAILGINATTNQAVCALQPLELLKSEFLFYYFMKNYWQFREEAVGGNQPNYSAKMISNWVLNLPSLPEQHEIVRLIDDLLARERSAQQAAEQALASIELMKKSILARAFRGELGTNKASEASAVELLMQLLAEN